MGTVSPTLCRAGWWWYMLWPVDYSGSHNMGLLGQQHKKPCSFHPVSWNTLRALSCPVISLTTLGPPHGKTKWGGALVDSLSGGQSSSHSSKVSDLWMNGPISQVNIFETLPSMPHATEDQLAGPCPDSWPTKSWGIKKWLFFKPLNSGGNLLFTRTYS